jgi:hypothetical protein
VTRYEYDLNDKLTRITDAQGNVKVLAYDGLKRKTFMDDPDRGRSEYHYDAGSNLTLRIDNPGESSEQRIAFGYDGVNRGDRRCRRGCRCKDPATKGQQPENQPGEDATTGRPPNHAPRFYVPAVRAARMDGFHIYLRSIVLAGRQMRRVRRSCGGDDQPFHRRLSGNTSFLLPALYQRSGGKPRQNYRKASERSPPKSGYPRFSRTRVDLELYDKIGRRAG